MEDINFLLNVLEGRTESTDRASRNEVRTKTTKSQYSSVPLEQAKLVNSSLYSTWTKLLYFEFARLHERKHMA